MSNEAYHRGIRAIHDYIEANYPDGAEGKTLGDIAHELLADLNHTVTSWGQEVRTD